MLCQLSYASDGLFSALADVLASAEHFIDYSTDHTQDEPAPVENMVPMVVLVKK